MDSDNLRDALAHRDRIRHMEMIIRVFQVDWFAELMDEEFPQLRHLELKGEAPEDLPYIFLGHFLGGSVPSLQHLSIDNINYEGLPSLLSSTPNLLSLQTKGIRLDYYMSPEKMVGALYGLTKLRDLCIAFWPNNFGFEFREVMGLQSPQSPTHAVLPDLTKLRIRGENEHFENLVNSIDAPRLEDLQVEYLDPDEGEELRAGNLSRFISRTETFKHAQFGRAAVTLGSHHTLVILGLPRGECRQARLSHIVSDQVYHRLVPFVDTVSPVINWLRQLVIMLSDVQYLSIESMVELTLWEDASVDWLQLLHTFPAVEVLHVSGEVVKRIASALNDIPEEMDAQVLPVLQLLWLDDGQDKKEATSKSVNRFLALRKQSGRPVVIIESHDEFIERLNSHQSELSPLSGYLASLLP